ncbi:MAG: Phage sandwich domain [Gemmatimonadetes bacterium]|nr:Phage sandwich domain [Gemmatimonadota bacterium]
MRQQQQDEWIAEHVMGWARDGRHFRDGVGRIRTIDVTSFGSFQPSSDVAAAFEALDSVGGIVTIQRKMGEWFVSIGSETRWAATLPLAICEALLASVLPTPSEGREA